MSINEINEINRKSNYIKRGRKIRKPVKKIPNRKLYGIFKRDKAGVIWSLMENSFSMDWSNRFVDVWDFPPIHYFKPQNGEFLVIVGRKHPDIEFTGNIVHHGNLEWKLKKNK